MRRIFNIKAKTGIITHALILIVIVIIVLLFGAFLLVKQFTKPDIKPQLHDDFPIWLMRDGDVAVYREMLINADNYEKTIVIQNIGDSDQEDIKIYESIPKEIAESASDLEFSIEPEIIEDDPLVLWSVDKKLKADSGTSTTSTRKDDSSLFFELGVAVFKIGRNVGLAYLTDVCETKEAKEFIKDYLAERSSDFAWIDGCGNYITELERRAQEQTSKKWQNQSEENKVLASLEPDDDQYKEIRSRAKETIEESKDTSTVSGDSGKESKPTSKPTPTPTPKASGYRSIDLSEKYQTFYYHKSVTPCSDFDKQISSSKVSIGCKPASAQWRWQYVREINTQGANKLKVKANLELNDYANFFGGGVKSDDYVDLIFLKSDPKAMLSSECNKTSSESDWPKCAVKNSASTAISHCGVPKYKESRSCDFDVDVSGLSTVYAVFQISDAWLTDQEGVLSNLKIEFD